MSAFFCSRIWTTSSWLFSAAACSGVRSCWIGQGGECKVATTLKWSRLALGQRVGAVLKQQRDNILVALVCRRVQRRPVFLFHKGV
jgi:hypothetical protein